MLTPTQQIAESLRGTATVTVTHLYGLGREAAAPIEQFPLAQIDEVLDADTCDLCRSVDGMILDKRSEAYQEWRFPSHINCRRIMVDIGKDEVGPDGRPTQPTFDRPPESLIERHGHFHIDPNKYEVLRMPSRPEGRDFIFVRGKAGEPGTLLWRPGLSLDALQSTLRDMADVLAASDLSPTLAAEAYARYVGHAADGGAFRDLDELYWRAARDWPDQGVLSREQYQALASDVTAAPDTWVATYQSGDREIVALYNPQIGDFRQVSLTYDSHAALITDLSRVPDPATLTRQAAFRPLRGPWGG